MYRVCIMCAYRKEGGAYMRWKRWAGAAIALMLAVSLLVTKDALQKQEEEYWTYNQMMAAAREGKIRQIKMGTGDMLHLMLQDGTRVRSPHPRSEDFKKDMLEMGIDVRESGGAPLPGSAFLLLLLPAYLLLRKSGEKRYVRADSVHGQDAVPHVTFADVAAGGEALACMQELVDFLKDPEKYKRYGARLPRGVMLYGPPGTGKTLMAKALAGEAGAPFFSMNGADFVQVYVGVGASRVRDLFKKARKAGGGVIFIDEIDAIGKKRDNSNDEREQTLNALLTEMSGFSDADGIVVLAATNRLDTLDDALLRAGRFDRQIEVGLPGWADRLKILQVHARNKPLAQDVSLQEVAQHTVMFSGAQLESMLNEAAIHAARTGEKQITAMHVEKAYLSALVGREKEQTGVQMKFEKRVTAYHEAGHALITHLLMPAQKVTHLSILPTNKGAAGFTLSLPEESMFQTKQQLLAMMCIALAGRAAEKLVFGEAQVTTGAAGDIRRARTIARKMVQEWEMGETGDTDMEIQQLMKQSADQAGRLLHRHRAALENVACALLEKEHLSGSEFDEIMKKQAPATINP